MKFFALTYKFFISPGGQKSLLSKAWDDISSTNNFTQIDLSISDYVLSNTTLWSYYEKVKSLETDGDFINFNQVWKNKSENYINRQRRSDKKDESWGKFVAKYSDLSEKLNSDTKQYYERVFKYESRRERITTILTTIFYLIRDLVGSIILDAIDAVIIITEDISNFIVAKSLQFMSFYDRCKNNLSKCFSGKAYDTIEPANETSPPTNEDDNDAGIKANIDKNTTLAFSGEYKNVKRKLDFGDQGDAVQETLDVSYTSLQDDPMIIATNVKSTPQSIFTLLSPFSQTPSTDRIRPRSQSR